MKTITLVRNPQATDWLYRGGIDLNDKHSHTEILGGKDIVRRCKYWTHHGGGNWITEWWINGNHLQDCINSAKKFGYEITLIDKK